MYRASKKSNPVSASRSLPVQRVLLPESYKHSPIPDAFSELAALQASRDGVLEVANNDLE
jgi:hypothetical protein